MKQPITADAITRFNSKVEKRGPDECWPWTGSIDGKGYGRFYFGGEKRKGHYIRAHRAAWIIEFGPIPQGLDVCHRCDNRPCCNPACLWLGTHADNNADMYAKGRNRIAPEKTYCPQGHELTPKNTIRERGRKPGQFSRKCRRCHYERCRLRYQRRKRERGAKD